MKYRKSTNNNIRYVCLVKQRKDMMLQKYINWIEGFGVGHIKDVINSKKVKQTISEVTKL